MNYSLSAFQEPRGVMRILQFIFAICAFATTTNFMLSIDVPCNLSEPKKFEFDYPFSMEQEICRNQSHPVSANLSSDSQFFVATGVLSLMYCVFIITVYTVLDELYRSKNEIPMADFMLTTILAIFWLSGSAAWANGASAFKSVTNVDYLRSDCNCPTITVSSFSRLNISLILGFLNFFLWASDLWFLYKETIWFHGRSSTQSAAGIAPGV